MGKNSAIEWTDHTFNPWMGCTKVSAGCKNCYAEAQMDHHWRKVKWGPDGQRIKTKPSYWLEPIKWNDEAKRLGQRHELKPWRLELFDLIDQTQHLDWLLVTKRPENILKMWPGVEVVDGGYDDDGNDYSCQEHVVPVFRHNVWLITSTENQAAYDARVPELLKCRQLVPVLGLSIEPLIGPIPYNFPAPGIDWAIIGGESGDEARPCDVAWIRSLVKRGEDKLSIFVKQLGQNIRDRNDAGFMGDEGDAWGHPAQAGQPPQDMLLAVEHNPNGFLEEYQGAPVRIRLADKKGGNITEWPLDLRIRQFPLSQIGTPLLDPLAPARNAGILLAGGGA